MIDFPTCTSPPTAPSELCCLAHAGEAMPGESFEAVLEMVQTGSESEPGLEAVQMAAGWLTAMGLIAEVELDRPAAIPEPANLFGEQTQPKGMLMESRKIMEAHKPLIATVKTTQAEGLPEVPEGQIGSGETGVSLEQGSNTWIEVNLTGPEPIRKDPTLKVEHVPQANQILEGEAAPETGKGQAAVNAPTGEGTLAEVLAGTHKAFNTGVEVYAAGSSQPSQAPTKAEHPDMVSQILNRMDGEIQQGRSSMRIQLHPHDLGSIDIRVTRNEQGITVSMTADQASTGRLLEAQADQLRQSLNQAGVQLSNLDINPGGHSHPHGEAFQPHAARGRTGDAKKEEPTVIEPYGRAVRPSHTGQVDYRA